MKRRSILIGNSTPNREYLRRSILSLPIHSPPPPVFFLLCSFLFCFCFYLFVFFDTKSYVRHSTNISHHHTSLPTTYKLLVFLCFFGYFVRSIYCPCNVREIFFFFFFFFFCLSLSSCLFSFLLPCQFFFYLFLPKIYFSCA
jgi:hypothetical protein